MSVKKTSESGSVAEEDRGFLAGLAAGLPEHGFWSWPAVVCVSGGADSLALLLGLVALAAERRETGRLIVAHAEHDLRPDAAADARFVEDVAAGLGVACVSCRLRVRDPDGIHGEGVEGRARRLRLEFFTSVARDHGARTVVVAHTADDQAETVLHRSLRGTGLTGLAGMAAARELADGVALLRPLLTVPRGTARAYLVARGQEWREDATNADTRHARNFLRHEILPRCQSGPYPAAVASLIRLGSQSATVAGAVRSAAEHLLDAYGQRHADGTTVLQPQRLAGLDRHLVAEIFVAAWRREGWPQRDMTARHYETLALMTAAAADTRSPQPAMNLPGGIRARITPAGLLTIGPA